MEQTSQEQRIEKLIEELDRKYFGLESLTAADVKEIIRHSYNEGFRGCLLIFLDRRTEEQKEL